MMPGIEIRHRVRDGLARGKLWRLTPDLGKLDGETSGAACYVCERPIPPHAEKAVIEGKPYHRRCWEQKDDEAGDASPASCR